MNACMRLCMQNTVKHSFPNFFRKESFSLIQASFTSYLEQNIRLGRSNPKLDQKVITWASWTNSRHQYLTIPIELIPIDHIPFQRAAMDFFYSIIIYAMSWTRRRNFSFSSTSGSKFFNLFCSCSKKSSMTDYLIDLDF